MSQLGETRQLSGLTQMRRESHLGATTLPHQDATTRPWARAPGGGQPNREFPADTSAGACYECDVTVERGHHQSSSALSAARMSAGSERVV